MRDLKRLVGEIHRRSLWQVPGIYLVGAWVAYEVIQSLTEGLGLRRLFTWRNAITGGVAAFALWAE